MTETELFGVAKRALGLLDLTSLTGDETEASIGDLCRRAQTPAGPVAAVCVYGPWVELACSELVDTEIRVATVANFPEGDCDPHRAERETAQAIADGADEVDVVFPWRTWLASEHTQALEVVSAARQACPQPRVLKVIIESGQLEKPDTIQAVTRAAIDAGADFIKTSTGKSSPAATPEAARLILETIKKSGKDVGFKASGGIRTAAEAATYLVIADEIFREAWVTPAHLRIGASSLLDDLLTHLAHRILPAPTVNSSATR